MERMVGRRMGGVLVVIVRPAPFTSPSIPNPKCQCRVPVLACVCGIGVHNAKCDVTLPSIPNPKCQMRCHTTFNPKCQMRCRTTFNPQSQFPMQSSRPSLCVWCWCLQSQMSNAGVGDGAGGAGGASGAGGDVTPPSIPYPKCQMSRHLQSQILIANAGFPCKPPPSAYRSLCVTRGR